MANSSMATLPIITAPSFSNLSTTVALYGEMKFSNIFEPQVVVISLVQRRSLIDTGIPLSIPCSPFCLFVSSSAALSRALSLFTEINAFNSPSVCSILFRQLPTSSFELNSFSLSFLSESTMVYVYGCILKVE